MKYFFLVLIFIAIFSGIVFSDSVLVKYSFFNGHACSPNNPACTYTNQVLVKSDSLVSCTAPDAVKVLGLKDTLNSHVEINGSNNYSNNICLSRTYFNPGGTSSNCRYASSCAADESCLFSVLYPTNSHMYNCSVTGGQKFCCKNAIVTPACTIIPDPALGPTPLDSNITINYTNLSSHPAAGSTVNCGNGTSATLTCNGTGTSGSCTAICSYSFAQTNILSATLSGTPCAGSTVNTTSTLDRCGAGDCYSGLSCPESTHISSLSGDNSCNATNSSTVVDVIDGVCCINTVVADNCIAGSSCRDVCEYGEVVDLIDSSCNNNGGSVCCTPGEESTEEKKITCQELGFDVNSLSANIGENNTIINIGITCEGRNPIISNSDSVIVSKVEFFDSTGKSLGYTIFSPAADCNKTGVSTVLADLNSTLKGVFTYKISYNGTHEGYTIFCEKMSAFSTSKMGLESSPIPDSSLITTILVLVMVLSVILVKRK
jgi:hypothetical protein